MKDQFACLGLVNPKSPQNVGIIMRAAGCYDVNTVFYTGQRYAQASKFNTDTKNVCNRIPLIGVEQLQQVLPLGAKPVGIELVEGAKPLMDYQHPKNAFYVFGPEDGSLSQDVVDWCEDIIYIPTIGCMNLAATVNVVLYDRMVKLGTANYNPDLILSSRDKNNKVKT